MIASDPDISAWVAANAGAGKTYTLANRVARLLLADARPQKILCLTFTKAAAAEMQDRLFKQLGEWAMLPDDDLRDAHRRHRRRGPCRSAPRRGGCSPARWKRRAG